MKVTRSIVYVEGTVQGVGFRPYVYRLAVELGLTGRVANTGRGVEIEIEGDTARVSRFVERLPVELPSLARIDRLEVKRGFKPVGYGSFSIFRSSAGTEHQVSIPPDIAICDDCLRELFDPKDRRYLYPFINCTNCGPRYTIVIGHPYDRPLTTMRKFTMCPRCREEYDDPANRRFHAQPNACPDCGPRLWLCDSRGWEIPGDPITEAREAIRDGLVVAVKGLGGFHLAVDAGNEDAVSRLRRRKRREEKPLAMMAPDLKSIRRFARLSPAEKSALESPVRPIVLLEKRDVPGIAPSVAPGTSTYGFMLPYTPVHYLLLRDLGPAVVLTSGNISEEPMVIDNMEALDRLSGIADLFLMHDRDIATACDDSVVRVVNGRLRVIRRARGFVPEAVVSTADPGETPTVLALGSENKNTFSLNRRGTIYPSPHIGDLQNARSYRHFLKTVESYRDFLEVCPDLLVHDLHPDYTNRQYLRAHPEMRAVGVQHHHAHMASIMAEHGEAGPVIGLIMDGSGYGTDGTVWGGELL